MIQSKSSVLAVVALALAIGGCKGLLKKRGEDTAPSATATPAVVTPPPPAPTPATPPPAETAKVDVESPVPEDFEEEAFQNITQANFRAEFEKLKKEIGGTAAVAAKPTSAKP